MGLFVRDELFFFLWEKKSLLMCRLLFFASSCFLQMSFRLPVLFGIGGFRFLFLS